MQELKSSKKLLTDLRILEFNCRIWKKERQLRFRMKIMTPLR